MSTKRLALAALLFLSAFTTTATLAAATAAPGCSNRDLKGSYGLRLEGEVTAGPIRGPIFGAGRIVDDGTGAAIFTITSPDNPGAIHRFDFALAGQDDLHAIASEPGLAVAAFATRQKKTHGLALDDVRGDAAGAPLAAEGRSSANGGRITSATQLASLGGQAIVTQTATGTYQVASDGTGPRCSSSTTACRRSRSSCARRWS